MMSLVRPELPTASVGSSQAPTAAVDNSASFTTRPQSTYKSGFVVQTNGATSKCGLAGEVLYDYDGSNQRVASTKAGVPTYFMHGHGGHLLWEETPHATLKEYIYLSGKQVAVREESLP